MMLIRRGDPGNHGKLSLLILLGGVLTSGCVNSASMSADSQAGHDDHGHGRPAHKPYTFLAAVGEVSRRGHERLHAKTPDAGSTGELRDIIHWLPEFAAETDLTRAQWEEVWNLSKQLELWAATDPPTGHATFDQKVSELRQLVAHLPPPADGESEPIPHHDHDHDHDHDHHVSAEPAPEK